MALTTSANLVEGKIFAEGVRAKLVNKLALDPLIFMDDLPAGSKGKTIELPKYHCLYVIESGNRADWLRSARTRQGRHSSHGQRRIGLTRRRLTNGKNKRRRMALSSKRSGWRR